MEYALLDWDKTLRKNYTLFCWIDYLVESNIIEKQYDNNIKSLIKKFKQNIITHDQLAELSGIEYAKSIKNIEEDFLKSVSEKFICIDDKNIYPFVQKLFDFFSENNIHPIIVSGAPYTVVSNYYRRYNIKESYEFKCEVLQGKFTGNIIYNYGYNKKDIIEKISRKLNCNPIIAIGDSESDFPMLDIARYGIIVNNFMPNKYINVDENNILDTVCNLIQNTQ